MKHVFTDEETRKGNQKGNSPESRIKATETRKINKEIESVNLIVNQTLREIILENKSNKTWQKEFLTNFMNAAKQSPNSRAGLFMADRLIKQNLLEELDSSLEKEKNSNIAYLKWRIHDNFFDKQKEVMSEIHQRRKIMCITSRRAGKTTMNAGIIVDTALIPDSPILYFNLTFSNAIKQIFDDVEEYSELVGLEISHSSKSEGVIEWINGSSLKISGNSNNAEADKARGFKARLVIIDEIGHQRNIDYMLNEVIFPLMADFNDSTLLLTGTPSRVPHHFSTKIWENDSTFWKRNWTLLDNPHIPNAKSFVDEVCKSKGLTIESPFIQREYFGRLVADTEALIFKNRKTYTENIIEEIKNGKIKITDIAIGVDYGFSDYNSMITVAYNKQEKRSYIIKEDKFNHASVSEVENVVINHFGFSKEICKSIKINPDDHIKIYCDTNEESITADLRIKHKLPAFNCFKYDKMFAIETLAEELRTGRMTIPKGGILDNEFDRTLYARDEEDNIINELDEETFHADALMALLYASRKVFFDMDYDISFKETPPKTSDYILDSTGTITGSNKQDDRNIGNFEDMGIIG